MIAPAYQLGRYAGVQSLLDKCLANAGKLFIYG